MMQIVLTTTPNLQEAETLAELIVNARLAACVQILPQMTSVYQWEGKLQKESEHLLMIKTLPGKWAELHDLIRSNHSYETPEIVAINADEVSPQYLRWLSAYVEVGSQDD